MMLYHYGERHNHHLKQTKTLFLLLLLKSIENNKNLNFISQFYIQIRSSSIDDEINLLTDVF
jgi:hypothetical protein